MAREAFEDAAERAAADPELKAPMTGLVRRVAWRQVVPRSSGPHDPEDAVEDIAGIAPRAPAPIPTHLRSGKPGRDQSPLPLSEVHRHLLGEEGVTTLSQGRRTSPAVIHLRDGF